MWCVAFGFLKWGLRLDPSLLTFDWSWPENSDRNSHWSLDRFPYNTIKTNTKCKINAKWWWSKKLRLSNRGYYHNTTAKYFPILLFQRYPLRKDREISRVLFFDLRVLRHGCWVHVVTVVPSHVALTEKIHKILLLVTSWKVVDIGVITNKIKKQSLWLKKYRLKLVYKGARMIKWDGNWRERRKKAFKLQSKNWEQQFLHLLWRCQNIAASYSTCLV